MKRLILVTLPLKNGFVLVRHGANHDVYMRGNKVEILGRHSDIPEQTAKSIISRNHLR